jgi:4-amino-4-deoxy-L-arabinose transferase-like glycosyltransferase
MTVANGKAQVSHPREQDFLRDSVLWIVILLTFGLRIAYNLALHSDGHPPSTFVIDESEYYGAAHMLAEGRGFSFFDTALWVRPPLYVTLLAAVMLVAGDGYLPALLVQSALSALTLVPLGWLAFQLGGRRTARFCVVLGLLYLPLTLFAGLLLSETLFVFLFAWALVALVKARWALSGGLTRSAGLWCIAAGALLGLGVLTRSTALAFVPPAALWLAWGDAARMRVRIAAAGLTAGVCVLCLVPWMARNYSAYHRLILVDTTSGYNLWLASVGVRDEPRLQAELMSIPNPADRQTYAYQQAWANIVADPGAFVVKGVKESFDLWRPLFGAEERQINGYALGRVPAWHLSALFVFDDLLYVVILVAAVVGLALFRQSGLGSLTLLWVLLWVVMSFVFFAVTRFRLPVVVALLPWAAFGLESMIKRNMVVAVLRGLSTGRRLASVIALLGIVVLVVPAVSLVDTLLGVERWGQQVAYRHAEVLLRLHEPDQAIAEYLKANASLSDTRYGLAAAYLQQGQPQLALAQLTVAEPPDRVEPDIIKGEAARISGNLSSARSFLNSRTLQVHAMEAQDWAWDHLAPPPVAEIELGSGLDLGYIRGFAGPESDESGRSFRWTGPASEVRNLASASSYGIEWSGWRPGGTSSTRVALTWEDLTGKAQTQTTADSPSNSLTWESAEVPGTTAKPAILEIAVRAFVASGSDPRLLGVRISKISAK